jgi:hypothetical protein
MPGGAGGILHYNLPPINLQHTFPASLTGHFYLQLIANNFFVISNSCCKQLLYRIGYDQTSPLHPYSYVSIIGYAYAYNNPFLIFTLLSNIALLVRQNKENAQLFSPGGGKCY